jgi:hypothetical protein
MKTSTPLSRLAAAIAMLGIVGVSAGACSTGKPRPARIKSEFVDPDTSGQTIYLTAARDEARPVSSRSYYLGARAEARLGEPVAEVKNYTAGDRAVHAVLIADLKQTCGTKRTPATARRGSAGVSDSSPVTVERIACKPPLAYLDIPAGRTLRVAGGFEEAGEVYYLLAHETVDGTLFIATDRAGRLKRAPYMAWREVGAETIVTQVGIPLAVLDTSDPLVFEGPVVRYETEEVVLTDSADYMHFELDYAGMTEDHRGSTWHLLYKEYRRNPAGSPIFTKRLDYTDVGSSVELLGMKIQVHDVTPSHIVYTVLSD